MKGWLVRLAGGYAGLGALAFLIHRARYLSTSRLRDWTDHRSHQLAAELVDLRAQLQRARRELATSPAPAGSTARPSSQSYRP